MAAGVPSEQRMANQIASNLRHQPADRAAETLAAHIRRFWDPRMRARLFALVDAGADGLDPVVVEGARLLRKDQEERVG
ncbi:formate dehydrogenase subunit delta [Streptomyces brasiliensis]|uniref:NAD-dependent formate dehydrogenase subunit delta n=1 Tax=Streptomyces brasiliensis TaxID=1954 RepID=A0A917NKD9_9ACTN|nr:formate dehydrogenase subunit delta [Streptomyces brasiliensis]GGJ07024.1 NAD-dependent formate dehydrogenase subunit delta [Streptomyces brasiliensis]